MEQAEDAIFKVARDMVEVMLAEILLMYKLSGREVMRYNTVLKSLALAARDQCVDADFRAFLANSHSMFRSDTETQQREYAQGVLQDPEYLKAMAAAIRRVAELGPEEPQG